MSRLLLRSALRYHLRHPWQSGLAVLGVALGVAVGVSIDLATASAREAFRVSTETVTGRATHRIEGGPGGVPDEVFTALRVEAGLRAAAPVVEEWVGSPALPGRALRLLGVDPFSEGAVRPWLAGGAGGGEGGAGHGDAGGPGALDASVLPATPDAVFLSAGTAAEAGLEPGDPLPVDVGGRRDTLEVAGLLRPGSDLARRGMRDLLVVDVSTAQEVLGRVGRLSRVDVVLPEGPAGEALLERARAVLPPDLRIQETGARSRSMAQMIRAFDLNLSALSLLALLFGAFLIYNTVTFSVVQRRELLGGLRALGVSRHQVFGLVLGEAAVTGAAGSLAGLALGVVLGRSLVRLVTRTINDLYFVVSVEGLSLDPATLAKGAFLGVAATLAAALPAVLEATGTPPRATLTRSYLEERTRALVPRAAGAGLVLAALGGALLLVPSRSIVLAFAALFGLVVGTALLTPLATVWLVRLLLPAVRRLLGIVGTMAARGITAALSRTAPAAAALVVAVAVTVGLGAMISSFRVSVSEWLETTLRGDVYVSVPSPVSSRPTGTMDPALVEGLAGLSGAAGATLYRRVELPSRYGRIGVVGVEAPPGRQPGLHLAGGGSEARAALRSGRGVLVSEPFAYRNRVEPGDTIRLDTALGERALPVAGVYRDYGSDRGVVMMSRDLYRRLWNDPAVSSLALHAREGVAADALAERARGVGAEAAGPSRIVVRSNAELRQRSLEVFDRTFAITGVLRMLAFVVAFIGILSALMALQLERSRELGVLRANGLTPGQVWHLVTAQTGVLGAVAGLLALPAGLLLAAVMVHVVNRRSFGWSLDLHPGWALPAETLALALAGALLAGLYPAWRMARTSPARALREE